MEFHGDAAAVLPYDPLRRCGLVARLFRAPVFDATRLEELEEACAGMIEREDSAAAARREAGEELGIELHELEWLYGRVRAFHRNGRPCSLPLMLLATERDLAAASWKT